MVSSPSVWDSLSGAVSVGISAGNSSSADSSDTNPCSANFTAKFEFFLPSSVPFLNNLTAYGTLKVLDMQTILHEIARQIPDGEYLRDYNCATTGELRIIVKQQGRETRYVVKDYGGVIKLIHKP